MQKIAKIQSFNAVFSEEKEGGFSVTVPALPGCFSEGKTLEEAMENIKEAMKLYLEDEKPLSPKREFMIPVEVYAS